MGQTGGKERTTKYTQPKKIKERKKKLTTHGNVQIKMDLKYEKRI